MAHAKSRKEKNRGVRNVGCNGMTQEISWTDGIAGEDVLEKGMEKKVIV